MRGATPGGPQDIVMDAISIHAPHAGRDQMDHHLCYWGDQFQSTRPMRGATLLRHPAGQRGQISIHAPHAGRDRWHRLWRLLASVFQSTRPMRGATPRGGEESIGGEISIHAPHAGRDLRQINLFYCNLLFQSTRPMRGATGKSEFAAGLGLFQSTRPMRGATRPLEHRPEHTEISIHAPHAGRDGKFAVTLSGGYYFNPRAPCGARHGAVWMEG